MLLTNAAISRELGATLKETLGVPSSVLSIEGVAVHEFDFIDLAPLVHPSYVVPVTVKSLLFAGGLDRRSVKLALRDALAASRAPSP